MTNDLISRQAAIEEIVQNVLHDKEGKCSVFGALFVLKNLPTAEKKGRDISGEVSYYCDFKCSLCGADIGIVEGGNLDGGVFNFCPNCGARMEEESENI